MTMIVAVVIVVVIATAASVEGIRSSAIDSSAVTCAIRILIFVAHCVRRSCRLEDRLNNKNKFYSKSVSLHFPR